MKNKRLIQKGKSLTADLQKGTWTFKVEDAKVSAGNFYIVEESTFDEIQEAFLKIEDNINFIEAFTTLKQLKKELGEECIIDWELEDIKYTITFFNNRIYTCTTEDDFSFLAFKTEEARDKFLEENGDLIEIYFKGLI